MQSLNQDKNYCFIDASNLFYGGERLLGWKVDYKRLIEYLKERHKCHKVFFYSGFFIRDFSYKFRSRQNFPLNRVTNFFEARSTSMNKNSLEYQTVLKDLKKLHFYKKLETFGYNLRLKPIKIINSGTNQIFKANCDVDLAFDVMRLADSTRKMILMSGDGDFEILVKYFLEKKKEIIILSNPKNTARSLKIEFSNNYRSIQEIRSSIELKRK